MTVQKKETKKKAEPKKKESPAGLVKTASAAGGSGKAEGKELSINSKEPTTKENKDTRPSRFAPQTPEKIWLPKTELGREVKKGDITTISDYFKKGKSVLEAEIVDKLIPDHEVEFAAVGQSKGKFGGGKRNIWKQTQKKTREGNNPKFSILAITGNKDGYIGIGYGKAKETMPAREKATRISKLNLIKIRRGCGSWECNCREPHSIPFKVSGKCGAAEITLIPAPKGTGLCIEKECQKILNMAGIKDVYSKSRNKKTKYNLINACFDALKKLSEIKVGEKQKTKIKYLEGSKNE